MPIGAWHGNGRKAQWWSPILLAVWDERLGLLVAACKCMSGFTDAFYKVQQALSLNFNREATDPDSRRCQRGIRKIPRRVPKNLSVTTTLEVSLKIDRIMDTYLTRNRPATVSLF